MFPGLTAERDGRVDRLQDSLTATINRERHTIDRELSLGGHRVMHNPSDESKKGTDKQARMVLESSQKFTRVMRHLRRTAREGLDEAQTSQARVSYTAQRDVINGELLRLGKEGRWRLWVPENDPVGDTQYARYLGRLPSVPPSEFFSVDWDGPNSLVNVHTPTGRDPTKHRHWYEVCGEVGEPTEAALSNLEKMRNSKFGTSLTQAAERARKREKPPRLPPSTQAIQQLRKPRLGYGVHSAIVSNASTDPPGVRSQMEQGPAYVWRQPGERGQESYDNADTVPRGDIPRTLNQLQTHIIGSAPRLSGYQQDQIGWTNQPNCPPRQAALDTRRQTSHQAGKRSVHDHLTPHASGGDHSGRRPSRSPNGGRRASPYPPRPPQQSSGYPATPGSQQASGDFQPNFQVGIPDRTSASQGWTATAMGGGQGRSQDYSDRSNAGHYGAWPDHSETGPWSEF
jgi:hypothetical protein